MTGCSKDITKLRKNIDEIDDAIHDLIMKRTEIVEEIAIAKGINPEVIVGETISNLGWRPAREIEIIRRLIEKHNGKFPKASLVRIWREMFGALINVQTRFVMAVCMPERGAGYLEIARDQYGSYSPFIVCSSVGQVIREIVEKKASVGVIPIDDSGDVSNPWWVKMLSGAMLPKVVARLPVIGPGEGRGGGREAYVIATIPNEPTGQDKSLLVLEVNSESVSIGSIKTAFEKVGIDFSKICSNYFVDEEICAYLIEANGFIDENDKRLHDLMTTDNRFTKIMLIGGYAVQINIDK